MRCSRFVSRSSPNCLFEIFQDQTSKVFKSNPTYRQNESYINLMSLLKVDCRYGWNRIRPHLDHMWNGITDTLSKRLDNEWFGGFLQVRRRQLPVVGITKELESPMWYWTIPKVGHIICHIWIKFSIFQLHFPTPSKQFYACSQLTIRSFKMVVIVWSTCIIIDHIRTW